MRFELGRGDLPDWAEDRLYTHVDIVFSWRDRGRLLLSGKCRVEVRNTVEHAPGRHETTSAVHVVPRRWPWSPRLQLGYAEIAPEES